MKPSKADLSIYSRCCIRICTAIVGVPHCPLLPSLPTSTWREAFLFVNLTNLAFSEQTGGTAGNSVCMKPSEADFVCVGEAAARRGGKAPRKALVNSDPFLLES